MTETSRLEFDVSSALALGARSRQEDALAVAFPVGMDHGFAILSDGMGGHASGDLASRTIVAEMFAGLSLGTLHPGADLPNVLRASMRNANANLTECVKEQPTHQGMGGTVVAAVAVRDKLHWISVGDSVLYLFRDETLSRLNADHSMAPQIDLMLARGMLSEAEAADHPQRNCLTSALMGGAVSHVDCPEEPTTLRPDDILILASDGLQFLPDPIIEALLLRARRDGSQEIAQDLMDALSTMDDPEQDNTSIVVIRVQQAKRRVRPSSIRSTSNAMFKAFRRAVTPPVQANPRR